MDFAEFLDDAADETGRPARGKGLRKSRRARWWGGSKNVVVAPPPPQTQQSLKAEDGTVLLAEDGTPLLNEVP